MTRNEISARAKRRWAYRIALVVALSTSIAFDPIPTPVRAAIGDLDPSFGGAGKVVTNLGGFDVIHALAVQNDGKIIAAGTSGVQFAAARYNANGSLDSGFGGNGTLTTDFSGGAGFEQANALVLQPDGKIVAAGYTPSSSGFDFALARYNSDGTADKRFGNRGKVTTNFFGFSADEAAASALVIQSDGKIIAAGSTNSLFGLNQVFGLARYNEDGTLDPSFGNGGTVAISFFNNRDYNEIARAVVIQPDGRILAAGAAYQDFG
ncbi:MAG: delta-60 repeat domain-containing protein, partial [Blastocatellia bacterium]